MSQLDESHPHVPVLLNQVISLLAPRPGGRYVDATAGAGGHLEAILTESAPDGQCLGLDRDESALELCRSRLSRFESRVKFVRDDFRNLGQVLDRIGWGAPQTLDGLLLDIGVSSMHLDQPSRGFSFRTSGPLDMRMDQTQGPTASDLVNDLDERSLAGLIDGLGEERFARRVARAIVDRRSYRAFEETTDLADCIANAIPRQRRQSPGGTPTIHPATRTFQALRIAVNGELDALGSVIPQALRAVRPGGRIAIISFHSLEDRIVKLAFSRAAGRCECPPRLPVCICGATASVRVLTPKPLVATEDETNQNPRSRSARLRVVEVGAGEETQGPRRDW